MKGKMIIFSLHIVAFFCLHFHILSTVYAGVGINFTQTEFKNMSEEASVLVFTGLSNLYDSLKFIELQQVKQGKEAWENAKNFFLDANGIYRSIADKMPPKPIVTREMQFDQIGKIANSFYTYKVPYPPTMQDLSIIAKVEVNIFTDFLLKNEFTKDMNKNREIARNLYEQITRLTTLAISISELAATQK